MVATVDLKVALDAEAGRVSRRSAWWSRLRREISMWRGLLYRAAGALVMVDDVSVAIVLGQTLALVEESGCGQTTTGKAVK